MSKLLTICSIAIIAILLLFACKIFLGFAKMSSTDEIRIPLIQEINNIDDIVKPYLEHKTSKAISIGIYSKGKVDYYNYGICSEANPIAPTENSIYEIGSITKTFTGILLAQMVAEGKVNYDDPISKYLPHGVAIWDDSLSITLKELASHTSGLPRIPSNLYMQMFKNIDNPYKDYTDQDLYSFLKKYSPKDRAERKVDYSNLGMGLLGNILAITDQTDYKTLIEKRITTPLRMEHTYTGYREDTQITGHNGFGKPTPGWEEQTLEGAGAIRSNVSDLMKYLEANLKNEVAYAESHTVVASQNENMQVGLAWFTIKPKDSDSELLFHNGGSGGFRSVILISKEHQTGVVVLSNCIESVDDVGFRLMEFISEKRP